MKMKPLFICYPRCSTCQKALNWLQERGIEVEVRDIVQQNPSEAELEEWIDRSGLAVNRFFNTSGLRYKALNLKEKVRPERHSYDIIRRTGEFVINLTTEELARATDWCGVRSGRDHD